MPATYLHPDVIARAQALGLKARAMVEGLRVGDHKSPYRGFSVEFLQHREYVPGDDVKHIDWKSYGRSERYTIKQYEQETNYAAHLLLDGSRSMLYGEGESNKLEYAKLLAKPLGSPPDPTLTSQAASDLHAGEIAIQAACARATSTP